MLLLRTHKSTHSQTGAINIWIPNSKKVNNSETDFCDGIKFVALVEALSKKKIPGRVKESQNHNFWHDNVAWKLDFLKESEKLQLVNIGKVNVAAKDSQIHAFTNWCKKYLDTKLKK